MMFLNVESSIAASLEFDFTARPDLEEPETIPSLH